MFYTNFNFDYKFVSNILTIIDPSYIFAFGIRFKFDFLGVLCIKRSSIAEESTDYLVFEHTVYIVYLFPVVTPSISSTFEQINSSLICQICIVYNMVVSKAFLCCILVRQIICKPETIFQISFVLSKRIFVIQRIDSFLDESDRGNECNFKFFNYNLRTSILRSLSSSRIIVHIMSLRTYLVCGFTFW